MILASRIARLDGPMKKWAIDMTIVTGDWSETFPNWFLNNSVTKCVTHVIYISPFLTVLFRKHLHGCSCSFSRCPGTHKSFVIFFFKQNNTKIEDN